MKEYKSITIILENVLVLGSRLNEYAKKGWYIKDTITNGIDSGNGTFEFIYLLERDIKLFDVRYTIDDDVFNKNYFAYDFDDVQDKFMRDDTLSCIDAKYEYASTKYE